VCKSFLQNFSSTSNFPLVFILEEKGNTTTTSANLWVNLIFYERKRMEMRWDEMTTSRKIKKLTWINIWLESAEETKNNLYKKLLLNFFGFLKSLLSFEILIANREKEREREAK
jgi:hypothetical protein